MKIQKELPLLIKRKDFKEAFGLSDSLYYKLIHSKQLPTVTLNGRQYIHRDKLFELFDTVKENKNGH